MANPKGMLNTRFAPKEMKNIVVKVDQLVDYLKKDLKELDKNTDLLDKVMNVNRERQDDLLGFAQGVLKLHKKRFIDYTKGYRLINNKQDEELRKELLAFRIQKAKQNKVPPYYVFKNEELENIMKIRPKTIAELSKAMQDVRVKMYGNEILKIIGKY